MADGTEDRHEEGRMLFAGPAAFLLGVVDLASLPAPFPAEVAFAGRSNVGKSSLINALTGRRDIARVSNTPGRTRELNFFTLKEGSLTLVDMPGYGYARRRKAPGAPVARAGQGLSARSRVAQTRLRADRRATWHQAGRRSDLRAARRGGGHLPSGADQGRQAEACRARHNDGRNGGTPAPATGGASRGARHVEREIDRIAGAQIDDCRPDPGQRQLSNAACSSRRGLPQDWLPTAIRYISQAMDKPVTAAAIDRSDIARILSEALPFMQLYDDQTVVIKFGGHAMVDPELSRHFARDIVQLKLIGINPIVVHGGGPQIGRMLDRIGVKSDFIDGLRVTDRDTMSVVEMVLSGSINKAIVASIHRAGGKAVGISGKDGNLLIAKKLELVKEDPKTGQPINYDLGFVGDPDRVNPSNPEHHHPFRCHSGDCADRRG